jgi:hypothetical protein
VGTDHPHILTTRQPSPGGGARPAKPRTLRNRHAGAPDERAGPKHAPTCHPGNQRHVAAADAGGSGLVLCHEPLVRRIEGEATRRLRGPFVAARDASPGEICTAELIVSVGQERVAATLVALFEFWLEGAGASAT